MTWPLHAETFERFGGVVDTVVADNLKAAAVSAAFGFAVERPSIAAAANWRAATDCTVDAVLPDGPVLDAASQRRRAR